MLLSVLSFEQENRIKKTSIVSLRIVYKSILKYIEYIINEVNSFRVAL